MERSYKRRDLEALNVLQHPVWIFDAERKAMWWGNRASLDLWAAGSLEELVTRDFASDMSRATESRIDDQIQQMVREGKIFHEQWTYYPRGQAKTVNTTNSLVYIEDDDDEDDEDEDDEGQSQQRQERKPSSSRRRPAIMTEAELPYHQGFDESLTREIELLRHVPLSVCEFSLDGGSLVYRNPEDCRVFGARRERSEKFLERFVDRDVGSNLMRRVQEGQECRVEAEQYVAETVDETTTATAAGSSSASVSSTTSSTTASSSSASPSRWFAVTVRKAHDPVNAGFVIIYTARDITEIRKAREASTKAKLKSEFLSVIAHELRTPLHQVVGYTDMLELTPLSSFQLESVKLIQRSAESLMAIINDLLNINRIERGKVEVAKLHFPFRGLVNACIATAEKDATLKGLALVGNFSAELPLKVVGDANKTRTILLNLLENAVKFTDSGSVSLKVFPVTMAKSACVIRFEVRDTGIGISQDDQELVFEQYRQVNMAATREHGGTGLGLSICKSLTTILGGSISVQSETGSGSTFTVDLPFELPPIDDVHQQACGVRLLALNGPLRVLVVEDNQVNAKMVERMLERMGHTVLMAENGQIALDILEQEVVELVLMDVQMPVMDGIEATRQIRTRLKHSKQSLPIVGLTASFQHSDMRMYMDVGMNTCLSKPIRLETLKKALDTVSTRCAHGLYADDNK